MRTAFYLTVVAALLLFGCAAQTGGNVSKSIQQTGNNTTQPTVVQPSGTAVNTTNTTAPAEAPNTAASSNETVVVTSPPLPQGPVQPLSVTMSNYAFSPSNISVKKGSTVQLTVTSVDRTYGFAIPAYNINSKVDAGKSDTITFVADKTGTFPIKDSYVVSGAAYNMVGTLTVTG